MSTPLNSTIPGQSNTTLYHCFKCKHVLPLMCFMAKLLEEQSYIDTVS